MSVALFLAFLAVGAAAVLSPYRIHRVAWPADPPDVRDDVARAVSSLRDLEFGRAAGTIPPSDYGRLRAALERSAFARAPADLRGAAPVRTLVLAALIAALATGYAAIALPRAAGDRAPGVPATGTVPAGPSLATLEERARSNPRDIPTQLALADTYAQEGRSRDAVARYQAVLAIDKDNVPALDGLGLLLVQSNEYDGALLALDRVLTLRPRDPDALFLEGLVLYKQQDWSGAVDVWGVYLDVGEFHPAVEMVRPLYADAKGRIGR